MQGAFYFDPLVFSIFLLLVPFNQEETLFLMMVANLAKKVNEMVKCNSILTFYVEEVFTNQFQLLMDCQVFKLSIM